MIYKDRGKNSSYFLSDVCKASSFPHLVVARQTETGNNVLPWSSSPSSCSDLYGYLKIKDNNVGFPGGTVVESLPANAGNTGSGPGLGRSHMPRNNYAREPQLLSLRVWSLCSATREAAIVKRPAHCDEEVAPTCRNWRRPSHRNKDPTQPRINIKINK